MLFKSTFHIHALMLQAAKKGANLKHHFSNLHRKLCITRDQ